MDLRRGIYHTPWTKFVKRNFLTEKEINFYEAISGGDYLWTIELFACSERFLRIPNAVYFWRDDSMESMTRSKSSTEIQIRKWGKIFASWIKFALVLNNKIKILKENSAYIFSALVFWIEFSLGNCVEARLQVESEQVYDILRREFEGKEGFDLIIPFFFSLIDSQQKNLLLAQQEYNKLNEIIAKDKSYISKLEELDRRNKDYISEMENFIVELKRKIDTAAS